MLYEIMRVKMVSRVLFLLIVYNTLENVIAAYDVGSFYKIVEHFKFNTSSHILTEYEDYGIYECAIRYRYNFLECSVYVTGSLGSYAY